MPANTTNGLPYPLGTDRVADGDDAIKNLAEAVDAQLWGPAGGVQIAAVTLGAPNGWYRLVGATTEDTSVPGGIPFRGGFKSDGPGLLTIPEDGIYAVSAIVNVLAGSVSSAGRRFVGVGVSPATSPFTYGGSAWANNASGWVSFADTVKLLAGDQIGAYIYTDVANHYANPAGRLHAVRVG